MEMDNLYIDKSSVIPAYYQLMKLLEHRIRRGDFKPGETLPSETEIAETYGISRMTVRRAISELSSKKIVSPQKGKGTYVSLPKFNETVFELNDFFEDMKKKGIKPSSRLIEAKHLPADKIIAEKLQIPENTKYIFFRSILYADEEPLVYDTKYIVYAKQRPLLEELSNPSLQDVVMAHNNKIPIKSLRILQVTTLTEQESFLLNVAPMSAAFLVEQLLYDQNDKPVGWGKSLYRGDRYQLTSRGGIWY